MRLRVPPLSDDQLFDICQRNDWWRFERDANGELIIAPPKDGTTGSRSAHLTRQLVNWNQDERDGIAFGCNCGFLLPNGAMRSPTAAWIATPRWTALTREQRKKFVPFCPDFAIELMSPADRLSDLQGKMAEYRSNGARLGWLIHPDDRTVHVYRPGEPVEILTDPTHVSADPVLPGFTLDLRRIFRSL